MKRSLLIAAVCIVAVAASIAYYFTRPPSKASREQDEAGWRVCAACGYEWHSEVSELVAQSAQNPNGEPWVKCPRCGEWQGMPGMLCPKCGRRFPTPLAERNEEYVPICTWCGYAPPRSSLGGNETPSREQDAGPAESPDAGDE
jgi:ribosomal protein L32